ncbi:hypothetical protein OUZ56_011813 [Daphnia magna]|uniref:Uncharacterized protein n=1 Tax=Daphnia magna TaxID=35525 RepID=A0ABQ9Z2I5_9CRUS|nr:hypothetical protein OUZ56_011813 [Daphnia magna]
MSAVIAGITHHEEQQDDKIQLLEQKLSETLSELERTIQNERGSSQENNVTIAAAYQYEIKRPASKTDTTVDKEIKMDPIFHQITTTDIKCVITATNIYSNNKTPATILEPLKIVK